MDLNFILIFLVDTVRILDGFIRLHKDASDEECTYTENVPIKSLYGSLAGYYFVLYTNDSGSTTLTERVKMTDLKNIEICSPFKNSDCFEVTVGPSIHIIILQNQLNLLNIE